MQSDAGFDLTKAGPLRTVLLWPGLPRLLQGLVLAAIIFEPEKFLAFLPALLVATVLLGRVWCGVCPLNLIGALPERIAGSDQDVPRWAATGALGVALYGLLLLRPPGPRFLVGLAVFTVFVSVVFRRRAFCRTLCPAAELLATYGRGGMIAIRPAAEGTSAACPAGLEPATLADSRDCKFCMSCVHQGGMRVLLRWPFSAADVRQAMSSWPAAAFVVLTSAALVWRRTGDERLAVALWPAAAILAWGLGGARNPAGAMRRLALPGSAILIAAHLAGLLPLAGAVALVAASVFLAVREGRKAGWTQSLALIAPLALVAAAFAYSLVWPALG
jgi:polyferredoxin